MATKASYFRIGIFTVAAVALLVAAVIALGAGAVFREKILVETYFDESVQGVDVGSPLKYRGVQVGNVDSVMFTYNVYEKDKPAGERRGYVLVRMAVFPKLLGRTGPADLGEFLKELVEQGLRIRIRPQGLTGLGYLEMDYVAGPERDIELAYDWQPETYYVPSAPSIVSRVEDAVFSMTETLKELEKADLGQMAVNLDELVLRVTNLVTDERVAALREEAIELLAEVRQTNTTIREFLEKPELNSILEEASGTAASLRRMVADSEADVSRIVADLKETAQAVNAATQELPETMERLNRTVRRLGPLVADQQANIADILQNIEAISANLRELTENAKRYPAYVLFGEPPPSTEPTE